MLNLSVPEWLSLLLVLALAGWVTDCATGTSTETRAIVLEKVYVPSRVEYGNTTIDGKTGTTTTYTSEEWKLLVRDRQGDTFGCNVSAGDWGTTSRGDSITVPLRIGRFTGHAYRGC